MLYTGIINQSTRNVRSDAKEPDHVALDNCAGKQNRCINKNIDESGLSCGKTSQSGGTNETMEEDDEEQYMTSYFGFRFGLYRAENLE